MVTQSLHRTGRATHAACRAYRGALFHTLVAVVVRVARARKVSACARRAVPGGACDEDRNLVPTTLDR